MVIVEAPGTPWEVVIEVGLAEMVKSGLTTLNEMVVECVNALVSSDPVTVTE
jgi:hypothetical protein